MLDGKMPALQSFADSAPKVCQTQHKRVNADYTTYVQRIHSCTNNLMSSPCPTYHRIDDVLHLHTSNNINSTNSTTLYSRHDRLDEKQPTYCKLYSLWNNKGDMCLNRNSSTVTTHVNNSCSDSSECSDIKADHKIHANRNEHVTELDCDADGTVLYWSARNTNNYTHCDDDRQAAATVPPNNKNNTVRTHSANAVTATSWCTGPGLMTTPSVRCVNTSDTRYFCVCYYHLIGYIGCRPIYQLTPIFVYRQNVDHSCASNSVIFHNGPCQPDDSKATPVPRRQHRLGNVTKKLPNNTTLTRHGNHDMTNCTIFTNKKKTTSRSTANVATVSNAGSDNDSRQHTSKTPAERTLHEPVVVEDLQRRR